MDLSAEDQKGTFGRPSILQTRLCADYIVIILIKLWYLYDMPNVLLLLLLLLLLLFYYSFSFIDSSYYFGK